MVNIKFNSVIKLLAPLKLKIKKKIQADIDKPIIIIVMANNHLITNIKKYKLFYLNKFKLKSVILNATSDFWHHNVIMHSMIIYLLNVIISVFKDV